MRCQKKQRTVRCLPRTVRCRPGLLQRTVRGRVAVRCRCVDGNAPTATHGTEGANGRRCLCTFLVSRSLLRCLPQRCAAPRRALSKLVAACRPSNEAANDPRKQCFAGAAGVGSFTGNTPQHGTFAPAGCWARCAHGAHNTKPNKTKRLHASARNAHPKYVSALDMNHRLPRKLKFSLRNAYFILPLENLAGFHHLIVNILSF